MSSSPEPSSAGPPGTDWTAPVDLSTARALAESPETRAVVLVEGVSDYVALRTLAQRLGRDLHARGVQVLPMGGATNVGHFFELFGPGGAGVPLAGLCDAGEARHFQRALIPTRRSTSHLDRAWMEERGFYVCEADLEDELIRALGTTNVVELLGTVGDLAAFRTFQRQPAQRGRPHDHQLRRFLGTRSGRKIEYARLLVERVELRSTPRPLQGVLAHIRAVTGSR